MSTYYDYREVGVMIAHKLMKMEGWKVYGYKADESDSMTDYYDPASWDGVAEKNGYILCVNVYGAEKEKEIKKYNYDGIALDTSITEKIAKLEQMTIERGASEAEEKSSKRQINLLMIGRANLKPLPTSTTLPKSLAGLKTKGRFASPGRCQKRQSVASKQPGDYRTSEKVNAMMVVSIGVALKSSEIKKENSN